VTKRFLLALALAAVAGAAPRARTPAQDDDRAQTKTLNLSAYAELLRSDLRSQKVAILTQMMGFTEAEGDKFWPIYREYEAEMAALADERVDLIEEYIRDYATVTDPAADKMAHQALALEAKRQAVKARYYDRVAKATSPRLALRFLQVEHQLLLITDLQIASSLPVAPVGR
jgi:hypothetical protein